MGSWFSSKKEKISTPQPRMKPVDHISKKFEKNDELQTYLQKRFFKKFKEAKKQRKEKTKLAFTHFTLSKYSKKQDTPKNYLQDGKNLSELQDELYKSELNEIQESDGLKIKLRLKENELQDFGISIKNNKFEVSIDDEKWNKIESRLDAMQIGYDYFVDNSISDSFAKQNLASEFIDNLVTK